MCIVNKIIESSPYPELIARNFYYNFLFKKQKKIHISVKKNSPGKNIDSDGFFNHLKALGIKKGDLLVVHSSANGLNALECKETDLVRRLKNLVGETGTIVLPAFPDESKLKIQDGIRIYDPIRSIAWTGMLPNLMLRMKGSIRSEFPYNPLVANGSLAQDIMAHNLDSDLAHGKNSCWGHCVEHHAKILYLGVPAYHSFTVLHVVEDYQPDYWPSDWYEKRQYYVKTNNELKKIEIRSKKTIWSKYLAERNTESKYIKSGMLREADYEGIIVRYMDDSNRFVNELLRDWKHQKFLYIPERMLREENRIMEI